MTTAMIYRECSLCAGRFPPKQIHRCSQCGRPVCVQCAQLIDGKRYCADCLGEAVLPEVERVTSCCQAGVTAGDDGLCCAECGRSV